MKTHAQTALEAFLGSPVDWNLITPATKELWFKVASAVLGACDNRA